jgi:hypothetical protein
VKPASPTNAQNAQNAQNAPAQGTPNAPNASDGRSTSFRAVEGGNEMQSGEMLLVEAYAAIWTLLFVMLLLWWRRQRQIDSRITVLEQAVAKARAEGAVGGASGALTADREGAADA